MTVVDHAPARAGATGGFFQPRAYGRQTRLQPLAGSASGARHPPLYRDGLRAERVLETARQGDPRRRLGRLQKPRLLSDADDHHLQLAGFVDCRDLRDRHCLPRNLGGAVRRLARAGRPAQGRPRRRALLGWRLPHLRLCGAHPPALAALSRPRPRRRHRARARLHFAGVDAHQMVSRSAWHGDRHGDHGLRRRRDDRCPARKPA